MVMDGPTVQRKAHKLWFILLDELLDCHLPFGVDLRRDYKQGKIIQSNTLASRLL